jgi:multicomponent Na+:H+ antiporter subunit D
VRSLAPHFPALLVVVPLICAPLIVVMRSGLAGWIASLGVAAATLAMSGSLMAQVALEGTVSYALGSWPPPWGIEYRIDAASAFVAFLVALVALVVVPYCRRSVAAEVGEEREYLFYALLMLCLSGLLGMTVTGDAFNLFVFLEISSLSSYVLIALGRERRALTAAVRYLILGTVGATFYVIGVGLLYLATGTLNFADLAPRLAALEDARAVHAALAFITVGIGLKLALFPLHAWLPGAYTYAPSAVSAFLAATATKVALYVLIRIYYSVLGPRFVFADVPVGEVLIALSVAALFIASATAIAQRDLKRLLAYSSIGQIGYITLGLGLGTEAGLAASLAHIFNHGISKGAVFLVAGTMALHLGSTRFESLAGVGRTMPLASFAFVLGGLSLIGVPGTAGFASKWLLVSAALEAGRPWIAGAVLLSSLLAVAYVWRFVECAYFSEPPEAVAARPPVPTSMMGPALALTALVIAAGLHASPVMEMARAAAAGLMGAGR